MCQSEPASSCIIRSCIQNRKLEKQIHFLVLRPINGIEKTKSVHCRRVAFARMNHPAETLMDVAIRVFCLREFSSLFPDSNPVTKRSVSSDQQPKRVHL